MTLPFGGGTTTTTDTVSRTTGGTGRYDDQDNLLYDPQGNLIGEWQTFDDGETETVLVDATHHFSSDDGAGATELVDNVDHFAADVARTLQKTVVYGVVTSEVAGETETAATSGTAHTHTADPINSYDFRLNYTGTYGLTATDTNGSIVFSEDRSDVSHLTISIVLGAGTDLVTTSDFTGDVNDSLHAAGTADAAGVVYTAYDYRFHADEEWNRDAVSTDSQGNVTTSNTHTHYIDDESTVLNGDATPASFTHTVTGHHAERYNNSPFGVSDWNSTEELPVAPTPVPSPSPAVPYQFHRGVRNPSDPDTRTPEEIEFSNALFGLNNALQLAADGPAQVDLRVREMVHGTTGSRPVDWPTYWRTFQENGQIGSPLTNPAPGPTVEPPPKPVTPPQTVLDAEHVVDTAFGLRVTNSRDFEKSADLYVKGLKLADVEKFLAFAAKGSALQAQIEQAKQAVKEAEAEKQLMLFVPAQIPESRYKAAEDKINAAQRNLSGLQKQYTALESQFKAAGFGGTLSMGYGQGYNDEMLRTSTGGPGLWGAIVALEITGRRTPTAGLERPALDPGDFAGAAAAGILRGVAKAGAGAAAKEAAKVAPKTSESLIEQLAQQGVKHAEDKIVRIAKDGSGKIVFLEKGNARAGLQHIVEQHGADFARRGIPQDKIADAVLAAVTRGKQVGMQGTRPIFEVEFGGTTHYISVQIGSNGFIVGANPTPRRLWPGSP